MQNFSDEFFFPDRSLQEGLERLIIFPENTIKNSIPNGSVWIYRQKSYDPRILGSDVGCGVTAYHLPPITFDRSTLRALVRAVESEGVRIGQGNHFLNLTTKHPSARSEASMIWLHSDFNREKRLPLTYAAARERISEASSRRRDAIEKVLRAVGLRGEYHREWVHNSVVQESGRIVYHKGAVSTAADEHEGALLTNPRFGIHLYVHANRDFAPAMQHATGRFTVSLDDLEVYRMGRSRGLLLPDTMTSDEVRRNHESLGAFIRHFSWQTRSLGFCMNRIVITAR